MLYAESAQDMFNYAQKLWEDGDCSGAMVRMETIMERLDDFPEDMRKKIKDTHKNWQNIIDDDEETIKEIRSLLPHLTDDDHKPQSIEKLQSARSTIERLIATSDNITCRDMRSEIKPRLRAVSDSANSMIDGYIDIIISQNVELSKRVDSLRVLASKYHKLLPVLDSLRSLVTKYADNQERLEKELDQIVKIAAEGALMTSGDGMVTFSSPAQLVSDAVLDMIQSRIVVIGETQAKKTDLKPAQKDTISARLDSLIAWLDTSSASQNSREKAQNLKSLASGYKELLNKPQKRSYKNQIFGAALSVIVIIAILILIGSRKCKKDDNPIEE
jgi:myosin heavy subunit